MKAVWQDTGAQCFYLYHKDHPARPLGRIHPEDNEPGYFHWFVYLPDRFKKYGDDIGGMIDGEAKAKVCVETLLLLYGVVESEHTVAQRITDVLLENIDIDNPI